MKTKYLPYIIVSTFILMVSGPVVADRHWQASRVETIPILAIPALSTSTLVKDEPMTVEVTDVTDRSDYRFSVLQVEVADHHGKSRWKSVGMVANPLRDTGRFSLLDTGDETYVTGKNWVFGAFRGKGKVGRGIHVESPAMFRLYAKASKESAYVSQTFSFNFLNVELPPDPGRAGMETLEGIDSDGDGIRDDVQRHIVLSFADSRNERNALFQFSRAALAALTTDRSATEVEDILTSVERSFVCLRYVFGSVDNVEEATAALVEVIENTDARILASHEFDVAIGGIALYGTPPAQRKAACSFDPDLTES